MRKGEWNQAPEPEGVVVVVLVLSSRPSNLRMDGCKLLVVRLHLFSIQRYTRLNLASVWSLHVNAAQSSPATPSRSWRRQRELHQHLCT